MATTDISTQIVSITGVTAHGASDEFIVSAQKLIVSSIPKTLMKWAGTNTVLADDGGDDSPTAVTLPQPTDNILDVQRNGFSAREVAESKQGFIANTSSIHLATKTFPKYYIDAGSKVIVKPDPTASETVFVNYVDFLKIDDDCDLRNAVIFYAVSSEFSKLASSSITTWSSQIKTISPETPSFTIPTIGAITVASTTFSNIGVPPAYTSPTVTISGVAWATEYPTQASAITAALAKIITSVENAEDEIEDANKMTANIVLGVAEIVESVGDTDTTSSEMKTAADGLAMALTKFQSDGGDPALFGDQTQYLTGEGLAHVKDALELARDAIDTGFTTDEDSGSGDDATPKSVGYWLDDEDPEMVQATLQTAQTEIQRAQAHIAEWNATVQALIAEASGFASEMQARGAWTSAKAQVWNGYFASAQTYAQAAQTYLASAQGYSSEIQTRLSATPIKVQEYQAKVQDALNTFNDANVEYQAKLQEGIQQAQIDAKKAQQQAQLDATDAQQETSLLLQKENQEYANKLQKYSAELVAYQAEVGEEAQKLNSAISNAAFYSAEAKKYYDWAQKEVASYMSNNSKMIGMAMATQATSQQRR